MFTGSCKLNRRVTPLGLEKGRKLGDLSFEPGKVTGTIGKQGLVTDRIKAIIESERRYKGEPMGGKRNNQGREKGPMGGKCWGERERAGVSKRGRN